MDSHAVASLPAVEGELRRLDPAVRAVGGTTIRNQLARRQDPIRWFSILFGALTTAVIGLALAGVYSVLSDNVVQRTREIGVRMALGARATDIRRLVIGDAIRLTALGSWVGIVAVSGVARLLQMRLDVRIWDPPLFAAAVVALALIAVTASYRAARWAASVEPSDAIREA